eukprot:1334581-Prymnesium_polylepis.1
MTSRSCHDRNSVRAHWLLDSPECPEAVDSRPPSRTPKCGPTHAAGFGGHVDTNRTRGGVSTVNLLQTQARSTDQVCGVCPAQVSYALGVTAAYHVGSSVPNLLVESRTNGTRRVKKPKLCTENRRGAKGEVCTMCTHFAGHK